MGKIYNPILEVLDLTFSKSAIPDIESNYLSEMGTIKKWSCYSDYCLGDPSKPNDVITFSILPYIDDMEDLSKHIKKIARADIKKSREVKEEFTAFLSEYPAINFSFIIEDIKKLFGKDKTEITKSLTETFCALKEQYLLWSENQPEQAEHYKKVIKKIDNTIHLVKDYKKIKQITEMLLITFLGSYVCSIIVKKTKAEIFGWFSDRDSIHEVSDHLSLALFHNYLHGLSDEHVFQFAASLAASTDKPFYDEILKVPDYIAGTLADYNRETNEISKEKFNTVLTNYMAENVHNNFVFEIKTLEDNSLSCARVLIHKQNE